MSKCSRCSLPTYKDGICVDHFRKLGVHRGRRKVRAKKKGQSDTQNTVTELVEGMNKTKGFAKMLKYSLGCVKQLAVDEVTIEDIVSCGTIQAAMNGWGDCKEDEDIGCTVCQMITTTCANPTLTAEVVKGMEGKFGLFTHSLETAVLDDSLVDTVRAMSGVAKDPNGRRGLLEAGALDALTKCMKDHPHNQQIAQYGAVTLAEMAKDKAHAKQILESGAVNNVLEAMKRFPDNLELAEAAATLIANLAKADPKIAAQLKAMGVIDALVAANERHPYSQLLAEQTQTALQYVAGEEDIADALGQIKRGEMKSAKSGKVAKALSKLATLCLVKENVDYMHRNQGVEAVVAMVKNALAGEDKESQDALVQGLRAMARLEGHDATQSYAVMAAGGVKSMVKSLEKFPDNAQVVEAAITGLAVVQDRAEHATYVAKVGGTDAVFGGLEKHENNPHVAAAVLNYMTNTLKYEEPGKTLIANGGAHALTALAKTHMKDPQILESALMTMANMATIAEGREALMEAEALQAMVEALEAHPDNPDVIKAGLKAMIEAMSDPRARPLLKKFGAVDAITAALDRFPGDPELQALGTKALRLLAEKVEITAAQAKAVEVREKVEEKEETEIKQMTAKISDDIAKNMKLWEEMMRIRKAEESDRLKAYNEIKRREAEILEEKRLQTETELARRDMLEKQSQAIREQQDMITRIKQEKVEREHRKEQAKRADFEKSAWKRYEDTIANKPDLEKIEARAKLRGNAGGGENGDDSASDGSDDDF